MSDCYRKAKLILFSLCLFIFVGVAMAHDNDLISISGDLAPSGDGTFASFELPRLSTSGRVAFIADLIGSSSTQGIFGEEFVGTPASFFGSSFTKSLIEFARTNQASPDGDGSYAGFSSLSFSDTNSSAGFDSSTTAFNATFAGSSSTQGILHRNQAPIMVVARENAPVPDDFEGRTFTGFSAPVTNDSGFLPTIFQGDSIAAIPPARTAIYQADNFSSFEFVGDNFFTSSGLSGTLTNIGQPAVGYSATEFRVDTAFTADIVAPVPDGGETHGVFLNGTSGLQLIAFNNPTGTTIFGQPTVSDTGGSFKRTVIDGGTTHSIDFWLNLGGFPTYLGALVSTGVAAADGNGVYEDFGDPSISNATETQQFGTSAFHATLSGTAMGAIDDQGIFQALDSAFRTIVRTGDNVPGTAVTFEDLGNPVVNDPGAVLFSAAIGNGSGGQLQGAFISDGNAFATVALQGEARDGSVITNISFIDSPDIGGVQAFNDFGQVAYRADLADGRQGVYLFTPTLEFAQIGSGEWGDVGNWSFGLPPGRPHSVFIIPDSGTGASVVDHNMEGFEDFTTVRNLSLEPTGGATAELNLNKVDAPLFTGDNVHFTVTDAMTIGTNATVNVNGGVQAFVGSLNMQGGTINGVAGLASGTGGTIFVNAIHGFGTAHHVDIADSFFFGLAGGTIESAGGVLDVKLARSGIEGLNLTVNPGSTLMLRESSGGRVDIEDASSVELLGGTLDVPDGIGVDGDSTLHGFGTVHGSFVGGFDSTIDADGGTLTIGDNTDFNGFNTQGDIIVRSGAELALENKIGPAALGRLTQLEGGDLSSATGVFLAGGKTLVGHGNVNAAVAAQIGSTIVAEGALSLGDASAVDGFFSDGGLHTDTHTVTIHDANTAVLGSVTHLGDGVSGGTLAAGGAIPGDSLAHFFIEEGKNLLGRGNVSGNVKNNGDVSGDGVALDERLIFDAGWKVSGKGTFENTLVLGIFAPGESPGITSGTNQAFGGTVQFELGGLLPGSGSDNHDQINDSASILLVGDPILSILSFDGFIPEVGDMFTVMTWELGLIGSFGDIVIDPIFAASGLKFDLIFTDIAGSGSLSLVAAPVPIPAAGWLFGIAIASLFARRGRWKGRR